MKYLTKQVEFVKLMFEMRVYMQKNLCYSKITVWASGFLVLAD